MQLRWSHAVLYVRDLDATVDFYTQVLGFEVTDRGPLGPADSPDIVFMTGRQRCRGLLRFALARGAAPGPALGSRPER